jgi:hypothetical protein
MGRTTYSNVQDIAVLKWFKFFDDRDTRHHWRRHAQNACAPEGV